MVYLGDSTETKSVMGTSLHFDVAGIGTTDATLMKEYDQAIEKAFSASPAGTQKLKNIKAYRSVSHWPQYLGYGLLGATYIIMDHGSSTDLQSNNSILYGRLN
jgi:hypothetical protein